MADPSLAVMFLLQSLCRHQETFSASAREVRDQASVMVFTTEMFHLGQIFDTNHAWASHSGTECEEMHLFQPPPSTVLHLTVVIRYSLLIWLSVTVVHTEVGNEHSVLWSRNGSIEISAICSVTLQEPMGWVHLHGRHCQSPQPLYSFLGHPGQRSGHDGEVLRLKGSLEG